MVFLGPRASENFHHHLAGTFRTIILIALSKLDTFWTINAGE